MSLHTRDVKLEDGKLQLHSFIIIPTLILVNMNICQGTTTALQLLPPPPVLLPGTEFPLFLFLELS